MNASLAVNRSVVASALQFVMHTDAYMSVQNYIEDNVVSLHDKRVKKNTELLKAYREKSWEVFQLREQKASSEFQKRAKAELAAIGDEILRFARLVEVTKKTDEKILRQLYKNEAVHETNTYDEFVEKRIANQGDDKGTSALTFETEEGTIALAAVFKFYTQTAIDHRRLAKFVDIEGNVDMVKNHVPEPLAANDNDGVDTVVLYTISAAPGANTRDKDDISEAELRQRFMTSGKVAGAGAELIRRLTRTFRASTLVSTLSPAREFYRKAPEGVRIPINEIVDDIKKYSDFEIKQRVMAYLASGKEPVSGIHINNGAFVGDININRHDPIDPITVNYVYPASARQRKRNIALFNDKENQRIPIAAHLGQYGKNVPNLVHVTGHSYIPKNVHSWGRRASLPVPRLKATA